ncbi:RNA polymerase factor sigma-54 [Symbiobacterium thermophilum]|uniref:RNA polymerase sigma-54 factor n=1 Tax=Symbiobacterium thermophilum TaxID=2734 RepID=A0A953HYX2_SYMTR|nr:RNA polymerase factor sigma-54 [Symbiobacterium thermophilum]MBY6275207.1 RNA polymerase sigma-54 factor [Symbiobacterium thermophilum]
MRLGFELRMQQTQRLVMTPELRQAITVLQKPVAELSELIAGELLENPCLEVEPREPSEDGAPSEVGRLLDFLNRGESHGAGAPPEREEDTSFEPFAPRMPTLAEHLHSQLGLLRLDRAQERIARFLIGCIDDHGYLAVSLGEAAAQLGATEEQVEAALKVIQSLDPPGVGARSLQECLLIQWATLDDPNPLVPELICHHLQDLAAGRIPRIAERLGVDCAAVQAAADAIRNLDPKPGRRFGGGDEARYVVPDVFIERVGQEYVVMVNEAPLPRLSVSTHYRRLLDAADGHTRRYVEERIQSALWLIRSIEKRRLTLLRVTEAIVRFQREFFDRGPRHLRPLTLREVAQAVGVHESTVSRATSGKWAQTPQGMFELKYFFSSGVETGHGEGVAAEAVKRMIADLIRQEDPARPLSDQALAEALAAQGLRIARRTVAKYREEMGLPNSGQRRRY